MHPVTFGRLVIATAALGLVACGGGTSPVAAAPTPTATSSAPAATPAPTPSATLAPTVVPVPSVAPTAPPVVATVVVRTATTARGTVLTAANGRTVYTFNSDSAGSGMTTCNAGCVGEWPPVTVAPGAMLTAAGGVSGHLGHIARSDGRTQITYNGLALYFFAGDSGPGQTNGSYPGWSLVRP